MRTRIAMPEAGVGFYITVVVCDIVFGVLASMRVAWFSRRREFRAAADSSALQAQGESQDL